MAFVPRRFYRARRLTGGRLSIPRPSCQHAQCLAKPLDPHTRIRTASLRRPTHTARPFRSQATIAPHRQLVSGRSPRGLTPHPHPADLRVTALPSSDSMCWLTLTPSKSKQHKRADSDCSSAEIVRVRHSPKPRFNGLSIALPSTVTSPPPHHQHQHHQHHHNDNIHLHIPQHLRPHAPLPHGILTHRHRHPHMHMHPLHLHPLTPLHGPGKPLRAAPPPPPSSAASTCSKAPLYRTQIVEPAAVRTGTRRALRTVRERGATRRVGGYEVLGRRVPWDWECVSSVGSEARHGGKKGSKTGKGGLKYPPFGGMEAWM